MYTYIYICISIFTHTCVYSTHVCEYTEDVVRQILRKHI